MKLESEFQFLRRVRNLPPKQMLQAIEERWQFWHSDTVDVFDDEKLNDIFNQYLKWRRTELRKKVTKSFIIGCVRKLQGLTTQECLDVIRHNAENVYQGFFVPSIKTKQHDKGKIDINSFDERYNY